MKKNKNIAIIFAGGSGTRMGIKDIPKQFLEINNIPIIIHTLKIFDNHPNIDEIYIGCIASWLDYLKNIVKDFNLKKVKSIIEGGDTGQDTIYKILKEARCYNDGDSIVLIHDGVRPYIPSEVIDNNIEAVKKYGTAITCTTANETILLSKNGVKVDAVPIRKEMFLGQAPQSFVLDDILDAHEQIRKINPNYENISDSCTLYNQLGKDVHMVQGAKGNLKITDSIDYFIMTAILNNLKNGKPADIPLDSVKERKAHYEENN